MRRNENSKDVNPRWNLASPILLQIFELLVPTHGCPFIVQGQPIQFVPFGHFTHELPYHILPTPDIFFFYF